MQEHFRALVARDREFDNRDQHFRNRTERYQHALGLVKHLHLYKTKLGLNQTGASLHVGRLGVSPVLTHDVCMCVCAPHHGRSFMCRQTCGC